MQILRNKWTYIALSGLTIIGLVFSVYAFRALERSFYPRTHYGLRTIASAEEQYRQSFPSEAIREHYASWDRLQMVARLRICRLQQRHA
jgi:hypothetical protein